MTIQHMSEVKAENARLREELEVSRKWKDTYELGLEAAKIELAAAQLDAARYRNHCRNSQTAAWMGLDPNASDVLEQLDNVIDEAMKEVGHE